jgi:hypothetical protein
MQGVHAAANTIAGFKHGHIPAIGTKRQRCS